MTLTARPAAPAAARRSGDALPDASIGTVPILWSNASDHHPRSGLEILDEIARLGFEGTQLGAGFPAGASLRRELGRRQLRLAEAYVPLPLTPDGPTSEASDVALDILARLHGAGGEVLCVAIDGSPDRDAWAGRADDPATPGLSDAGWAALIRMLHEIADAAARLGHPTMFHPHAATYVETPTEIERLLASTDPDRIGLCLDTGHHLVAGGDPVATLDALGARVGHVHLKDVEPRILAALRAGAWSGLGDAVRAGLFTELGAGVLDVDGVVRALATRAYDGWLMLEQDHSFGPPSDSAAVSLRVLHAALAAVP